MIYQAKKKIADLLTKHVSLSSEEILSCLEVPKQFDHGHLAFPVFSLAKLQKMAPPVIAKSLAEKIQEDKNSELSKVEAVGGFLNFTFRDELLQNLLFSSVKAHAEGKTPIGYSEHGVGKTVIIDYASPNVAKSMHVGHLRAAVVGQAIRNLALSQGFKVIGINHLGDWGSQFGKLAWAYQKWADEYDFSTKPMESLSKIYVRFQTEAEKNPELEIEAASIFKRLEDGDEGIRQIWKKMIDWSVTDYDRLLNGLLKVKHDLILGESFYNDKMDEVVRRLKEKNLLKESEGAQVVFFDEKDNMVPCLIKKSDGASIYATRDLAAAIYRHEVLHADQLLYVVGQDQILHFRQIFKVLEMMGYEWAKDCHHISFGLYRFKEGKMSSRAGRVILFEDVINQAIEIVGATIEEKNPDLQNKDLVSKQVAVGAVIFNDLVNDRVKNVEFDWDRILSVEGDSGPYVQYTNVRCQSILRKYGKPVSSTPALVLSSPEERKLIYTLLRFQDFLSISFRQYKPNILAQYLLEVCADFSHFYHKNRIVGEAPEVAASRASLVHAAHLVLTQGLGILNIESPEAM